jgi:hypothetical protein
MAIFLAWYDSTTNVATVKVQADRKDNAPDYVVTVDGGFMEVQTVHGEKIFLNETMQTMEQTVILFAGLLSARDTAS